MNIVVDQITYKGMWTYKKQEKLLEANLFDIELDLYWKKIEIFLIKKIRENRKFSNLEELITQIKKDEKKIRESEITVMTFGTFDYFHEWHKEYLKSAQKYGNKLITIVALDETVNKIKGFYPDHSEAQRCEEIKKLNLTNHIIELWSKKNVYTCLEKRKPDVIFFWYDQNSFNEWLKNYYNKKWLSLPKIIRWSPYKENIYKTSLLKKEEK